MVFMAMAVVCSTMSADSCSLVYNHQKTFISIEACQKELDSVIPSLESAGLYVVEAGCVKIPGELA